MKLLFFIFLAAAGGIGLIFLYFHNPVATRWLPQCSFYRLTGLYCSGCGTTRALYAALHGDFYAAFRYNLLLFPSLILIGVLLWGSGRKVKLSLDRGDLWDERDNGVRRDPRWNYKTLADAVARRDNRPCVELQELSNKMPATKLPVGRIELELESGIVDATYELDLLRALGMLCDRKGTEDYQYSRACAVLCRAHYDSEIFLTALMCAERWI